MCNYMRIVLISMSYLEQTLTQQAVINYYSTQPLAQQTAVMPQP